MAIETQVTPRRADVPAEYTWDFTEIYPADDDWEADVAALEAMAPEIAEIEGTVGRDAESLLHALTVSDRMEMLLEQIYVYAHMRKDADGSDPQAQAMESRAGSLVARFGAAVAFIQPEILAIPPATLQSWLDETPGLAPYRYYLDRLMRRREHVRSPEIEAIMAEYSEVTRVPSDTYSALTNVDITFPTIDDDQGRPVQLSESRYGAMVESPNRRVRRDSFFGIMETYSRYATTLGSTLSGEVRSHVLHAHLKNYPSALAAAVEPNDVPVTVYQTLLATIDENLPLMHRYTELRQRILGLDELHYYDLRAPLFPMPEEEYPYETSRDVARAALEPLGPEYRSGLDKILDSRWVDVYENVGKRTGAYSGGSYTTPPFILLNYQNRLHDVYTLVHELGHSLHSYFTRATQPYVTGDYTIFVAEVASTLNEALLTSYLLRTSDDPVLRRHLLVHEIEGIRSTIFRQTLFAQFELDIHQQVENRAALTSDWMSERYYDLTARYYGPALVLDDVIRYEWVRIPHFYYDFYVYQYATGKSAALALAAQIEEEGQPAVDRYLRFLHSGSSASPIQLLSDAGVDMTSPEPIEQAMQRFDELLQQLEQFV